MVSPITIAVREIKCIEETNEVGSDEPYVLVVGVNLKPIVPNVEAVLYGVWDDVDTGETHGTVPVPPNFPPNVLDAIPLVWRKPFWGLNGQPAAINNPDDVIFLVALMENDDGKPKAARGLVKGAVVASLASSTQESRAVRIQKLIADMNSALAIPTGAPNFDDQVGSAQELRLTSQDLSLASTGVHTKSLRFAGDGGKYDVVFELKKG
jgi:hypothetical protein